jgi:hypothetical protein
MPLKSSSVANSPIPSKGLSLFGKGALETDFNSWKVLFGARMKTDTDARKSWTFLQSKGCKARDLELMLYRICVDKEDSFWDNAWEAVERTAHLQIASRIRRDAEILLSMIDCYSGEVLSSLENAYHHLSKALIRERREAELQPSDPYQNCYLAMLVAYVFHVTDKRHFAHLAALVRCGCKPDDPNGGYASDAVRQAFNRFRRQHPIRWKTVEKVVDDWCRNPRNPERSVLIMLDDLDRTRHGPQI